MRKERRDWRREEEEDLWGRPRKIASRGRSSSVKVHNMAEVVTEFPKLRMSNFQVKIVRNKSKLVFFTINFKKSTNTFLPKFWTFHIDEIAENSLFLSFQIEFSGQNLKFSSLMFQIFNTRKFYISLSIKKKIVLLKQQQNLEILEPLTL